MLGFKENFNNFLKSNNKHKKFEDKKYYLYQGTQEKILSIQEKKQLLIEQMHELLKKADAEEEIFFNERGKSIASDGEKLFFFKKGGIRKEITRGDVMVAGINGFDLKLGKEVPRQIKKEFVIRETRRRIQSLYNKQLITAETENANASLSDRGLNAYAKIEEESKKNSYETKKSGLLAERMVESYLTKLFIDHPELPFELESADVYEDVRNKIDFKLRIKKEYVRGVKIGTHTGIQFTINQEKVDFKKQQIERSKEYMKRLDKKPVDDLILVSISLQEIQDSLQEWNSQGKNKSIAGPSEHWGSETKKLVFTKMLEKLPSSLSINPEELWGEIELNNMNKKAA